MPSPTRSTKQRTFSISVEASEAIDDHAERENMSKSMVVETAVMEYLDESQADRIESKVDDVLSQLEGSAPPSSESNTHTHTESGNMESDGGVSAVRPSAPQKDDLAKVDSFDEYKPELPEDYYLTEDCLKNSPEYVEQGGGINEEHIQHITLSSKGTPVRVKTAVCAGVIRYEQSDKEVAHERDIKETASDLLGSKRNARRHFDEIVSHFYDGPTAHPEVGSVDDLSSQQAQQMCSSESLYALTFDVLDDGYWRYESTEAMSRIVTGTYYEEADRKQLIAAYNNLVTVANNPENYVPYLARSIGELECVYSHFRNELVGDLAEEVPDLELPEGLQT